MSAHPEACLQTGHIGLNVSDLDQSKEFYQEVFGFTAVRESREEGRRFAGSSIPESVRVLAPIPPTFPLSIPGCRSST